MIQNCQVLIEKLLQTKQFLVENQLKQLGTFDSIYFRGKIHFDGTQDDGTQNYLVFNQCTNILKELLVEITEITEILKDCLKKKLTYYCI